MTLAEVAAKLRRETEEAERQRVAHVGTDTIVAEQYLGYKLGYEQAVSLLEADPDFSLRERIEALAGEMDEAARPRVHGMPIAGTTSVAFVGESRGDSGAAIWARRLRELLEGM